METAKIIFKSGVEIDAELNGSSLITDFKPNFPSDISGVKVVAGKQEIIYENPDIVECASFDGRYWFALIEISSRERAEKQIRANVEYIAMMSGIDLEE